MRILSELRTIELTINMNTLDSIYNDLLKLGVRKGDILLVHSSLSSLGWVCGGAQAVLMALKQAVGTSGTLVMPSHSGEISDPAEWSNPPVPKEWIEKIYESMPAFDIDLSPTRGMGRISELFRTLPESIRSNHPQVSFSASGKYANAVIDNHQLTPQFGMNTPLGKLYELNAKVLLLGVNYYSCTSFHLAEALNGKMPRKKMGASIIENNKRFWKWFEDYAYDAEDFEQIGNAFEENSNVTIGEIGNAKCRIFNIKAGVDFAGKWLQKNRFNT
ncbi:AAC(3) family N-acetyltransferase [Paenibacillus sp. Soil787]|uniref:aminoglycoside N(3)-acetyltransferase n=1 Tax=Paenibacillus sp. Soil787 TaxID=1736411 RepID=UPI0009E9DAA9